MVSGGTHTMLIHAVTFGELPSDPIAMMSAAGGLDNVDRLRWSTKLFANNALRIVTNEQS